LILIGALDLRRKSKPTTEALSHGEEQGILPQRKPLKHRGTEVEEEKKFLAIFSDPRLSRVDLRQGFDFRLPDVPISDSDQCYQC
jgi:hypothetical protein